MEHIRQAVAAAIQENPIAFRESVTAALQDKRADAIRKAMQATGDEESNDVAGEK
jgi:hypothetical protein